MQQGREKQIVITTHTAHYNPRGRKPLLWSGEPDSVDHVIIEKAGARGSDIAFRRCSEGELRSLFYLMERIARSQIDPNGNRRPLNPLMFTKLNEAANSALRFWSEETVTAIAAHHWDWLDWGIVYVLSIGGGGVKVGRTNPSGFFKRMERHRREISPDLETLWLGLSPMHTYAEREVHYFLSEFRTGRAQKTEKIAR